MTEPTTFRTVRLPDYLIEQGAGADASRQVAVFTKILNGSIPAFVTIQPTLPSGASLMDIQRYANSTPREASALGISVLRAEIQRAALGHSYDWDRLANLTLHLPVADIASKPSPVKAVPREQAHKENILAAIRKLKYDPTQLPPRKNGHAGVKHEVRTYMGDTMSTSAYNKAWSGLRKSGDIAGG